MQKYYIYIIIKTMIKLSVLANQTYKIYLGNKTLDDFFDEACISKEKKKKLKIEVHKNCAYIQEAQNQTPEYSFQPIQIIYEDTYCIVVNKPPFLLVHNDGHSKDTVQSRVNAYLKNSQWPFCAQAVHRLDYETSGLLLFCKVPLLQNYFDEQFRKHTTIKEYMAVTKKIFPYKQLDIKKPIARDRHQSGKMRVGKTGKEAFTHIEKIQTLNKETLVKATLHTGRKHQIRVHLSSIGFPIRNDKIYGSKENKDALCLESYHLGFEQPFSKKFIDLYLDLDKRFYPFKSIKRRENK